MPIQNILGTECIGDSLTKINSNFTDLDTRVTSVSTTQPVFSTFLNAFSSTAPSGPLDINIASINASWTSFTVSASVPTSARWALVYLQCSSLTGQIQISTRAQGTVSPTEFIIANSANTVFAGQIWIPLNNRQFQLRNLSANLASGFIRVFGWV